MAEILTFGAQELLKKVASLATQEFSLVWGFNGEIAKLRESLLMLEAVLRDAEHPRHDQGEAVKLWVKKLQDIAQQADDVLDDYGYELLRRKVQVRNQMKKKVQDFFSLSNPLVFRDKMAHKIRKINTSLDELNQKASAIGLVARLSLDPTTSHGINNIDRETYSIIKQDENNIIGRDTVVADTVQALIKANHNQQSDLSVLAIVGMGGLGKTTLAKKVFNESEISRHFDKKIWICVSTPFEVRSILRGILEALKPENAAVQAIDAICNVLREELKRKRYLLILDDVWNEDAQKWNDLMSCLLRITDAQGCSIVVTTRSDKVAKMVETLPRCDLRKLSDDECWLILKDKAIPVGSIPIREDQERVGKEIAKKCGGVPLVAKVLGNIMRSKTINEWNSILDSKLWKLPEEEERIMSILKLSFDELKYSSLKQCFAYCSMFIKDFVMKKDDLVQLWMAQGWLHSTQTNMEMEDRGNEYFNILAESSLFQDVITDFGNATCKMHDLVHDLAERVSNMTNFRSLFSNGEALGSTLLTVRSLRVLNLYKADIDKLPSSIGKLTHLRYLNVMKTNVKAFPKSIGQLYHLQTFKMPYHVEEFPKQIADMINLRHVYFGKHAKVPVGVLGRLTNLRSLPFLKAGKETGPRIEELGGLNHLRDDLTIYNLEHVRDGEEAVKAKLVDKIQIRRLTLDWKLSGPSKNFDNQDEVLEGLKPNCNLEILKIKGFMGAKFPSWLLLASNLKEIRLAGCNNCERAPILGHLPNLTHVKMTKMQNLRCLGSEFYGYDWISRSHAAFPALRSLRIEEAENLIEWAESGMLRAFPCLEKLTLRNCKQLRSTPSRFPSLKKLVIREIDSGIPISSILSNDELTSLTYLEISGVQGLASLPEGTLSNNKNLAYLEIENCKELSCIAPSGFDCCASLEQVSIMNCPRLRYLPDSLLPVSLKVLAIRNCKSLVSIPIIPEQGGLPSLKALDISGCPQLSRLPEGLQYCTSLRGLGIQSCPKIKSIPIPSQGFPSLGRLWLSECPELTSLPSGLGCCTSLVDLKITDCPKVTSIPIDTLNASLQTLCISNLEESLPILHGGFTSLRRVTILNCQSSQIDLQFHISLHELAIRDCPNVETVSSLDKLISLRVLKIHNCSRLTCLPSGLAVVFNRLKYLSIGPFWKELDSFPAFQVLPQLESLHICGWPKLKSLPEQIQHFSSLTSLSITSFEGVEAIPEWLGNLASLTSLDIWNCSNLMYLPSVQAMQRLTKLISLSTSNCPLLSQRCREDRGPEWPKISHIQYIYNY